MPTFYWFDSCGDYYGSSHMAQGIWTSVTAPFSVSSGSGRGGSNSIRCTDNGPNVVKTITAVGTVCVGFAFKFTTLSGNLPNFCLFQNSGTNHVYLHLKSSGDIEVFRGDNVLLGTTSGVTMLINTYYHIQAKVVIHDTTGSVVVKINDVEVLNLTNVDTKNGSTTTVDRIVLGFPSGGGNGAETVDLDDVYIADDFGGDLRVGCFFPDGAGNSTQFTPSAGSNFQNVDEASPNDDTDYNSSATVGHKDLFTMQNLPTGAIPKAVGLRFRGKKTDAGARSVATSLRHGTTDVQGDAYVLTESHTYSPLQLYNTNPVTAGGWTEADVNALQTGYEVTA
ncbi:MAG TPA: hypothetical protein VNL14_16620 [Candidatus Acidoferrales bacterium]|nr:hypothetical protein [Candidatus Acidoferrales bacterium]